MGSDRRKFFNQLVNLGALTGLASMFPADALAKVESSIIGETPTAGLPVQAGNTTRTHTFHAHAQIVHSGAPTPNLAKGGLIRLPEEGGFRSQVLDSYRSSQGLAFKSAYMHVAGTRSSKTGYGWVTLATAIVNGLNLNDVVTADLVFAQVSTEHPLEGYVPSVTFLGSRFENLRIAGRVVEPIFDLGICGPKPDGDKAYLQDGGFLARVSQQQERLNDMPGLPDWARQQYHNPAAVGQTGKAKCSLITSVDGAAPGTSFGHILDVPGFGSVSLAELTVDHAFQLGMVHVEPGLSGIQPQTVPPVGGNGTTSP